jgi:hypothetical protein
VQDQEVDLVDPELARALVEGVQRLVVAVVGDPDLRLDEDLGAVEAGATDRLADLALVEVCRGGVDVSVPGGQRRLHGRDGLVRGRLKDAEADGRHLHAIVQLEQRSIHTSHVRHR